MSTVRQWQEEKKKEEKGKKMNNGERPTNAVSN
jgi:hypothetical protein